MVRNGWVSERDWFHLHFWLKRQLFLAAFEFLGDDVELFRRSQKHTQHEQCWPWSFSLGRGCTSCPHIRYNMKGLLYTPRKVNILNPKNWMVGRFFSFSVGSGVRELSSFGYVFIDWIFQLSFWFKDLVKLNSFITSYNGVFIWRDVLDLAVMAVALWCWDSVFWPRRADWHHSGPSQSLVRESRRTGTWNCQSQTRSFGQCKGS